MSTKPSTGLNNLLLTTSGLKEALTGVRLRVYAGTEPASADAALGGAVLLNEYTGGGDGVTALALASTASGGQIAKDPAQIWRGTGLAAGDAVFLRFEMPADDGSASTTAVRLQGSVGNVGKELNLNNITYAVGAVHTITDFFFAQPTA